MGCVSKHETLDGSWNKWEKVPEMNSTDRQGECLGA